MARDGGGLETGSLPWGGVSLGLCREGAKPRRIRGGKSRSSDNVLSIGLLGDQLYASCNHGQNGNLCMKIETASAVFPERIWSGRALSR